MYGRSRCLSLHSSPRSLDNLINLVSLSLPTFFARHQVSSVSRQFLLSLSLSLSPPCSPLLAFLPLPSLPPSLPLDLFSFRSTTSSSASSFSAAYLYHGSRDQWIDPVSRRKGSLSSPCVDGDVRGGTGAYHNSGWRDHSKFIRHRSDSPSPER